MPKSRLLFAVVVAASLASTGCIARWMNRCNPGPCERPFHPLQRMRAAAQLPPPEPMRPLPRLNAAKAVGPQAVVPPHSRFHPVPTHPVFAAHYEELDAQHGAAESPDARRAPPLEVIRPGKPLRPIEKTKPVPQKQAPTETPMDNSLEPAEEPPPLPRRSGSSGVTLQGPIRARQASSGSSPSIDGQWRARRPGRDSAG